MKGQHRRPRRHRPYRHAWLIALGLVLHLPAAAQQLLFEEFSLSSPAFSPNGDGVLDTVVAAVRLNQAAFLLVRIDSSGVTVRTLLDSVAVSTERVELVWDGKADPVDLDARDVGEGTFSVRAGAWSGGSSAVAGPLDLLLDRTPPQHVATQLVDGDETVRDGETVTIETTWDGEGYDIRPDFSRLDSDTLGGLREVTAMGATTRIAYRISFYNSVADTDSIPVFITATDSAGNAARDATLRLNLHNAPLPLGSVPEDSSYTVRNSQGLAIISRWDGSDYGLAADFSAIDNGTAAPPIVSALGDGAYRITYTISPDNTVPDGESLAIPITATTRFGDSFTDASLRLCLSNHPPEHLGTWLQNQRTVFRNSDTIRIETHWRSPSGLDLTPGANFEGISSRYVPGDEDVQQRSDTTFILTYILPPSNAAPDADSVLIPVHARDAGCGYAEVRPFRLALDNTPPEAVPVISVLPATSAAERVGISGTVPAAQGAQDVARVALYREADAGGDALLAVVQVLPLDGPGWEWSAEITLVPGAQEIYAVSRDEAGNESDPSPSHRIVYGTGPQLEIPRPFRPGDAVTATHPNGWDRIRVLLLNLEGGLVREWTLEQPGRAVELVWDGRNGAGDRVRSGPYLLRWEGWLTDGGQDASVRPLLYVR